jgi:hydrogenase-1 operon protein HyaE
MTLAMPASAGSDPLVFPVIAQLFAKHGYARVDGGNFDTFTQRTGRTLLLFIEDPVRYKEALDVAVIVPEIVRAYPDRFAVGVLLPEAARECHPRYGFRRWPALVMLRDGRYVGAVDGLRTWDEYLAEVARLLASEPSRPPSIGIAVKEANGADGNHDCASA